MRYPVAIEPGTETEAFGVVVPDLPGCFSAGDTMEEAMANTEEAIAAWIETALDSGQDIPQPSSVDALRKKHKEWKAWVWAVVKVDPAVLDDRERARPPWLDVDDRAVLEVTHVQLARGGLGTAVREAVDDHATHATDALAAVVVEGHRLFATDRELLIQHVEHLQEGHVFGDVLDLVGDHLALGGGVGLPPNPKSDVHL